MLRPFLLLLAVVIALGSLLTWCRAPDYLWAWKATILVGEFGHWLLLLPLILGIVAACGLTGGWRVVTLLLCALAIGGLARPMFSASRIARNLPAALRDAFGPDAVAGPAFDLSRLYGGRMIPRARVQTEVFSRAGGEETKLDFYGPAFAKDAMEKLRPCVIVIHGGGWDGGDRLQLTEWNHRLVDRGYVVAAIDYRLAPRWIWPAQRDDVLAAISWLRTNAKNLGLDPTRMVLLGRSAGAQIAAAVGYGTDDPGIRGVIGLYGPYDMPFAWSVSREDDALNSIKLFRQYFGGAPDTPARKSLYDSASAQLLARAGSPPTLLVHGVPDTLAWYRHSERLDARLQELGVRHYFLELPWATHAFDFNANGPAGQLADCAIESFLAATVPLATHG